MRTKEWYINGIRMIPTEAEEQAVVVNWARMMELNWKELKLLHHIPNEGKRGFKARAEQAAAGLLPGVCDLFLPVARCGYHGLYIEMKALDGVISKPQKEFLTAVREQGFCSCACFGADAAIQVLDRYMRGAAGDVLMGAGVVVV